MKIFGRVALILLAILAIFAAVLVSKALTLNRNAIHYLETNIPPIVQTWNPEDFKRRASPELLALSSDAANRQLFSTLSSLGKLKKLDRPTGRINVGYPTGMDFDGAWGKFTATAEFDAGPAEFRVVVHRHAGSWQFTEFMIDSPAFLKLFAVPTESGGIKR